LVLLTAGGAPRAARAAAATGSRAPVLAFADAFVPGRTEAQLITSYRRLRAMGVRVVRLDFRWISLERIGRPLHRYVWSEQDREVRAIRSAGLSVLGILDYGNPNYSRAGWEAYVRGQKPSGPFGVGDPQYYPPDDPRSFARFASDVARRYRSGVIGWEIWNEENEGWRFWEPKENPRAYGRLLCAADRALRKVDPGAAVVFGGLFFPSFIGTGATTFLDQVLAQGGPAMRRCFDAVAYHPYPYPFTSPEAQVSGRGSVIGAVDQLRAVLRRYGLGRTPLWNTEVGWPTNFRGNGVTEAGQARYVARLELLSWAHGVPLLTWYTWGDAPDPGGLNQEAHFGFFRTNGTAKPAYRALTVLRRELGGPSWRFFADRSRELGLPRGHRGVGEGFALEFSGPRGRHLLALWYANERPPHSANPLAPVEPGTPPQSIFVRLRLASPAVIVGMLGRRRPARHARELRLSVGQDPQYVVWSGH
jgi:polysaccharide biosynthesis protein PslG